ncbi:MAG: alpha/beta fold hydrolase [Eubacteriales bacterium]|nr:alpha/beta fold hydrolase [Eubacteriales bacterium]
MSCVDRWQTQERRSGFIERDHGHVIYYAAHGSASKTPVLLFHGGPGDASSESSLRYFNPEHDFVIRFDQRACGMSRCQERFEANQTQDLMGDALAVLDALGIESAYFFASSWGACLALITGIAAPSRVRGFCLRSVFMATAAEIIAPFSKLGLARPRSPEYQRFRLELEGLTQTLDIRPYALPAALCSDVDAVDAAMLMGRLEAALSSSDIALKCAAMRSYKAYELALLSPLNLRKFWGLDLLEAEMSEADQRSFEAAELESLELFWHYMRSACFMEEGKIPKALWDLRETWPRTEIVHGALDQLCPLHLIENLKRLKSVRLTVLSEMGHVVTTEEEVIAISAAYRRLTSQAR